MNRFFTILISLSFLYTSTSASSDEPGKDSLAYIKNFNASLETNLDSLINLWYLQNAIKTDYSDNFEENVVIPEFPDSVYIERLQNIPG